MPKIEILITSTQQRVLEKRIKEAGKGSLQGEIRKALNQYLAGPRGVEAAFIKLLEEKAPKDFPAMLVRLKKTSKQLDSSLRRLKARAQQPMPLKGVDSSQLQRLTKMAREVLGSAEKATNWLFRPNRVLGQRTPFSLLTSRTGVKRVETLLGRIEHGYKRTKPSFPCHQPNTRNWPVE